MGQWEPGCRLGCKETSGKFPCQDGRVLVALKWKEVHNPKCTCDKITHRERERGREGERERWGEASTACNIGEMEISLCELWVCLGKST
jgi:hypothetical protein